MDNTNSFIPKRETKSSRTLRFPDELISQLQTIATEKGISFNQLVVQCCEFALENLPRSNQDIIS